MEMLKIQLQDAGRLGNYKNEVKYQKYLGIFATWNNNTFPLSTSCPAEGCAKCYNNAEDRWNQCRSQSFLQHQPGVEIRARVCHTNHQGAAEDEGSQSSVPRARSHVDEVRKDPLLALDPFSSVNNLLTWRPHLPTLQGHPILCCVLPSFCTSSRARPALTRGPSGALLLVVYVWMLGWMCRSGSRQPLRWWVPFFPLPAVHLLIYDILIDATSWLT